MRGQSRRGRSGHSPQWWPGAIGVVLALWVGAALRPLAGQTEEAQPLPARPSGGPQTSSSRATAAQGRDERGLAENSAGVRGTSAYVVADELLAARARVAPVNAQFSWSFFGGPERRRMQGRIYIKDGDRFLMQFAEGQAGVAGMTTLVTPDGRWLYKYEAGAPLAMRWDLNYIQERTGLLGPRVQYDVTGGALLQVLRRRPDVVLENDQERESYPCRVLSYASSSLRVPTPTVPPGYPGGGVVRTRLYFRRSDGLLVAEQELGADGRVLSSYEVFEVAPVAAWPEGLFDLPDGLSFLDLTRQLTRRLLLADPLTPLGGGVPSRGGGAPPAGL